MFSHCFTRIYCLLRSRHSLHSNKTQTRRLKSKCVCSNSRCCRITSDLHQLSSKDPELAVSKGSKNCPKCNLKTFFPAQPPLTISIDSRNSNLQSSSLHWINRRPGSHKTSRSGRREAVASLNKTRSSLNLLNSIVCAKCRITINLWRLGSENARICSTGNI